MKWESLRSKMVGRTARGGGSPRPPSAMRPWLVLDRACGDACGDVALGDDEQDGGGDGGDDGGGHDGVPLLVVVADVVVDAEGDGLVAAAAVEGAGVDEVRPGPQ